MKLHKTGLVLALMTLMIICGILVEAEPQIIPKIPPIPITPTPPPPPPPPPPPKTLPPIIPTTTTSKTPPISPPAPPPPPPPPPPPASNSTTVTFTPAPTPTPTPTPIPTPTPTPTPTPSTSPSPSSSASAKETDLPSCSATNDVCPSKKTFCDFSLGICRPKGKIGSNCNNDNECLEPFVCNGNNCQYSDVGAANDNKYYDVKKVAIIGAIVVGVSGACGLVFYVYRFFKKKRDYEITSRLYSTDDEMSEPDPYPFNERTNSFSNNTAQPPRAPPKIHFDNIPPTRNRGFAAPHQGYNNYYNEYNNMRQNENGVSRTTNRLQQTRGNVVAPPQNYNNWNPPPQGGLFPIPSVKGNYGVPPVPPIPNNMKNFNNNNHNNHNNNLNHNQSSKATSNYSNHNNYQPSTTISDHSVDHSDHNDQVKTARIDSNTLSPNNQDSGRSAKSTYSASIIDYYERDSVFSKTLENKLPIFKRSKDTNNPDEPVPEKKSTTTSRIQTFGHTYDPKLLQLSESTTVEGIKESKKIV